MGKASRRKPHHIGSPTPQKLVFRPLDDIANYLLKLFAAWRVSRLAMPRRQE